MKGNLGAYIESHLQYIEIKRQEDKVKAKRQKVDQNKKYEEIDFETEKSKYLDQILIQIPMIFRDQLREYLEDLVS